MAAGADGSMFISAEGSLFACGSNKYNKLGLRLLSHSSIRSLLPHPSIHPSYMEGGGGALSGSGSVPGPVSPGLVFSHETRVPLRVQLPDPAAARSVSLGTAHSAVLLKNGLMYTFGLNTYGQLGREPVSGRKVSKLEAPAFAADFDAYPAVVEALRQTPIQNISCGDAFTVAIAQNGVVYSWGKLQDGRCGLGLQSRTDFISEPTIISMGAGFHQHASFIACRHSLAMMLTSTVSRTEIRNPKSEA